jgi:hypothetical protein
LVICPALPLPTTGELAAAGARACLLFCFVGSCASDKLANKVNIEISANSFCVLPVMIFLLFE